jgi:hypothetical protein
MPGGEHVQHTAHGINRHARSAPRWHPCLTITAAHVHSHDNDPARLIRIWFRYRAGHLHAIDLVLRKAECRAGRGSHVTGGASGRAGMGGPTVPYCSLKMYRLIN